MSPRFTFALAAVGVVLAGLPLMTLTGQAGAPRVRDVDTAEPEAEHPAVLTLRWSGKPAGITVRHAGQLLGEAQIGPEGECELECRLPRSRCWELEVHAEWPETQRESAQAVTLLLEPQAQPQCTATQWTYPGEASMHRIFTMKGEEP